MRPKPITLGNTIKLVLLLAPYIAKIEAHLPEIAAALQTIDGTRPQVLTALFTGLRDELIKVPGDMTKALALLVGRDPAWIASEATAQEFVAALPVLDEINDLGALWAAVQALGITARYKDGIE